MRYSLHVIALTLCLSACGPEVPALCETDHGLRFYGFDDGSELPPMWTCEEIRAVENYVVERLPQLSALEIGKFKMYMTNADKDPWGRSVAGYAHCQSATIMVWFSKRPAVSSFPHELVHAMQGCQTPLPIDEGFDEDHSNWKRSGIEAVLAGVATAFP